MEAIAEKLVTTCKNCEAQFEGKFCPNCSQKADTHRFTIKHFLHELFHAFTHTDKGAIFLIRELHFRPGKMVREYVGGKRKKYFSPITFFFVITAIQVFVATKSGILPAFATSVSSLAQSAPAMRDQPESITELNRNLEGVETLSANDVYSKLLTFLYLPALALLTWLFFRKAGFNYAENLVFNVALYGQLSLYFVVFIIVPFMLMPSLVVLWMMLYLPITWIYYLIAYRQFFGQGWGRTLFKGIALQVLYMILVNYLSKGMYTLHEVISKP